MDYAGGARGHSFYGGQRLELLIYQASAKEQQAVPRKRGSDRHKKSFLEPTDSSYHFLSRGLEENYFLCPLRSHSLCQPRN